VPSLVASEILNQAREEASTPSQLPEGQAAMYSITGPVKYRQLKADEYGYETSWAGT
jgi:hypothetical protein